jgi:hypothetical protein
MVFLDVQWEYVILIDTVLLQEESEKPTVLGGVKLEVPSRMQLK